MPVVSGSAEAARSEWFVANAEQSQFAINKGAFSTRIHSLVDLNMSEIEPDRQLQ